MRHADRLYTLFSNAIRQAVRDNELTDQLPQSVPREQIVIRHILQAAEARGAYAIIDRMLFRFGKYRLGDCTEQELAETLETINVCIMPPTRRMHPVNRDKAGTTTPPHES